MVQLVFGVFRFWVGGRPQFRAQLTKSRGPPTTPPDRPASSPLTPTGGKEQPGKPITNHIYAVLNVGRCSLRAAPPRVCFDLVSVVFKVHSENPLLTCPQRFPRRAALWQNTPPAETTFETEPGCEDVLGWARPRGSHNVTVTIAPMCGLSVKNVGGCPCLWAVWAVSAVRVLGRPAARIMPLGAGPPAKDHHNKGGSPKRMCHPLRAKLPGLMPLLSGGPDQRQEASMVVEAVELGHLVLVHSIPGGQLRHAVHEEQCEAHSLALALPRISARREAYKAKKGGGAAAQV